MKTDFLPVIVAYLFAFAVAALVVINLQTSLLIKTLIADVAATFAIFAFSRKYKNTSFYDAYWSIAPIVIALYWLFSLDGPPVDTLRAYMVTALVIWWGIRLTLNWTSHWEGLSHEDWRYPPVRAKAGKQEMWADLLGLHMFPTLIVFLACLPVYATLQLGSKPFGVLDILALIVTTSAILIETVSDIQLHRFVKIKKPGEFIKSGLWRYSRHPNYFGELGFWVGLVLFGLAAYPSGWWWIMPGAITIGLMFIFISIPMMDERSLESREGYADHMKRVSPLIPWFPR